MANYGINVQKKIQYRDKRCLSIICNVALWREFGNIVALYIKVAHPCPIVCPDIMNPPPAQCMRERELLGEELQLGAEFRAKVGQDQLSLD